METHSHGGAFQVVQVCVRHDAVFNGGPLQQQRLLDERRSATITTQSLANAGLVLVPFGKRRRLGSIACGVVEAGAAGTGTWARRTLKVLTMCLCCAKSPTSTQLMPSKKQRKERKGA